ncbi:ATP-binding protein [Desulfobacula phenolica]|uniref:ATPase family associated with various cellular activities (AAA) n=1 Tax=Desulfobacula phenolica TaxID=90732 RepID=A0A1H2JPT3_9BACT|nr:ATP-binding protein [Desulfobacula phenolica]SDU58499.1 ATPase family associated with various cellular activities (AAA) [Desulfobacula phenolica]
MNPGDNNAQTLERELAWFQKILDIRIRLYFEQGCEYTSIEDVPAPDLNSGNDPEKDNSLYARTIKEFSMSDAERIVLLLALIPHVRPQVLDTFFIDNQNFKRPFTEFGGWKGNTHSGFLPTGETVSFILAANSLEKRFKIIQLFEADHFFAKNNILRLENRGTGEPLFSGQLVISIDFLNRLTTGTTHKPDYNINFPAKLITTRLDWKDLVLPPEVFDEIQTINSWIRHGKTILKTWGFDRVIKPGYRSLFYGPSGTGKTLTASLIGKRAKADVYRIDLSMVVSKYIGETEKNLANVFDQAEKKNWILFFDEADALFGKRTQTTNSNDRHANQEVSYLLQRVEDYPGVVLLATNLKANIDEAFARRFQSVVYFPIPNPELRYALWKNHLNNHFDSLQEGMLEEIAHKYELSGGAIINVVRYGAVRALQEDRDLISRNDLVCGIAKELIKEGKTLQE